MRIISPILSMALVAACGGSPDPVGGDGSTGEGSSSGLVGGTEGDESGSSSGGETWPPACLAAAECVGLGFTWQGDPCKVGNLDAYDVSVTWRGDSEDVVADFGCSGDPLFVEGSPGAWWLYMVSWSVTDGTGTWSCLAYPPESERFTVEGGSDYTWSLGTYAPVTADDMVEDTLPDGPALEPGVTAVGCCLADGSAAAAGMIETPC